MSSPISIKLSAVALAIVAIALPLVSRSARPAVSLEEAKQLFRDGWYARGEVVARDLVHRLEAAGKSESSEAAEALYLIVESGNIRWLSRHSDATSVALRALELHERLFGPTSPLVGRLLRAKGWIAMNQGRRDEAEADWNRANAILQASGPEWEPELGAVMCSKAWLEYARGDIPAGRKLTERGLQLQQRHVSAPPMYVSLCMNSALFYADSEKSKQRGLAELLQYRERTLGKDHPVTATTHHNMIGSMIAAGRFAEAEARYRRNIEIFESRLGPESVLVPFTHDHIVALLQSQGELAMALSAAEAARAAAILAYGGSSDESNGEFTRGEILEQLGELEAAETTYRNACRPNPELPRCLERLGSLLMTQGRYEEANPLLEKLERSPEVWWPGMVPTGWVHAALGRLTLAERRFERARNQFQKAIDIAKEHLPATSSVLITRRLELAQALYGLGRVSEGLEQAQLAIAALNADEEQRDGLLVDGLLSLARGELFRGSPSASFKAASRCGTLARQRVRRSLWALADRQALWVSRYRADPLNLLLAAGARLASTSQADIRTMWDAAIRDRSLALDEIVLRRRLRWARQRSLDGDRLVSALQAATGRLATLSVQQLERDLSEQERLALRQAQELSSRLELELASAAPDAAALLQEREIGLDDVLRSAPPRTALLAYTRWHQEQSSGYVAFVHSRAKSEVQSVQLGPAEEIDRLVDEWTAMLSSGATASTATFARVRELGVRLRKLVWDPVVPMLGTPELVMIVPDGNLSLLSFAALPTEGSAFLLETGPTFHYLSAERDLVRLSSPASLGRGLLAVGGPAFGGSLTQSANAAAFRSVLPTCAALRTVEFGPLPESAEEVRVVGTVWSQARREPVVLLDGLRAWESAVRAAVQGKRWLHFATHGLMLDDSCSKPGRAPNPLVLSSLALTGANLRHQIGPAQDDGLLTAEEIATLELGGVEAVVLSGCRTGGGQVRPDEGVIGLRRAFQAAGVRVVVMSLSDVADHPARRWMEFFYKDRLTRGLTIPESVRQASLELLMEYRKRGADPSPSVWGAFVSSGDWR